MNLNDLLSIAISSAEAASLEILNIYHSGDFDIEAKDDKSPLTRADRKAHESIIAILKQTDLPILSEEGKSTPYDERKHWSRFWLVDPLDGTKEFIKRNGEFTVNIALIENQKPILGVVVVPVTGQVFYGANGLGAFLKHETQTSELRVRKKVELDTEGIKVVASRSHLNEETSTFIASLSNPVLVSKGSSLKFMLLAEGLADIYPRFAPTMEWDTGAAHAIVNQLGFGVYQKNSMDELIYNKKDLLNPSFICQ